MRTLYYETEPLVAGGHTQVKRSQRTVEAQETLRRDLTDWKPADVDRYIDRHYADYWLRTDAERRVEHAKLLAGPSAKAPTSLPIHAPTPSRPLPS